MRRASTTLARVSPTAISPPPRLAPGITDTASSSGTSPWAVKVATSRTAATLECTSQVKAAPMRKAVTKSPRR